jgi:hypothetical protein
LLTARRFKTIRTIVEGQQANRHRKDPDRLTYFIASHALIIGDLSAR